MTTMFGSVEELRAAYRALHTNGQTGTACEQDESTPMLEPLSTVALGPREKRLVLIAGAAGGAGTTTVALALAEALAAAALVEHAPDRHSGLSAAASTELGTIDGWSTGQRDAGKLMLYRGVPQDTSLLPELTGGPAVVDLGLWPLGEHLVDRSEHLVLVTHCSVPGARRLDAALDEIRTAHPHLDPIPVMTGTQGRTLPKPIVASLGPSPRTALERGRLVLFPEHAPLRVSGLTASPLPKSFQQAAGALVHLLEDSHVG